MIFGRFSSKKWEFIRRKELNAVQPQQKFRYKIMDSRTIFSPRRICRMNGIIFHTETTKQTEFLQPLTLEGAREAPRDIPKALSALPQVFGLLGGLSSELVSGCE